MCIWFYKLSLLFHPRHLLTSQQTAWGVGRFRTRAEALPWPGDSAEHLRNPGAPAPGQRHTKVRPRHHRTRKASVDRARGREGRCLCCVRKHGETGCAKARGDVCRCGKWQHSQGRALPDTSLPQQARVNHVFTVSCPLRPSPDAQVTRGLCIYTHRREVRMHVEGRGRDLGDVMHLLHRVRSSAACVCGGF